MSSTNESGTIPAEWRVRPAPSVATSDLGDEVVVLDQIQGRYYGLDGVGALVWQSIEEGASVGEIQNSIQARFSVSRRRCGRDLQQLLADLSAHGLIETEAP